MASELMSNEIALLAIFLLSVFVGFEVVSKVSTTLHTPLMSGANAIHGVILVGAIVVADHAKTNLELGLALAAVILATINMVGGFVVTDRMLQMFKGKPKPKKDSGRLAGTEYCPFCSQTEASGNFCANTPEYTLCSRATEPSTMCFTGPCSFTSSLTSSRHSGVAAIGSYTNNPPSVSFTIVMRRGTWTSRIPNF